MSWDDFQRNGFLGCDACYDHFKDALPSLMQRLHSDAAETIPAEASAAEAAPVSAKAHLESELQRAIAAENFEEAAQLRDADPCAGSGGKWRRFNRRSAKTIKNNHPQEGVTIYGNF